MRRIGLYSVVAILLAAWTGPSWGGVPSAPTKVIGTHGAQEFNPAANDTYLAWTANSVAHPRHYDAWSQLLDKTAPPSKMSAPNTLGYTGGSLSGTKRRSSKSRSAPASRTRTSISTT